MLEYCWYVMSLPCQIPRASPVIRKEYDIVLMLDHLLLFYPEQGPLNI